MCVCVCMRVHVHVCACGSFEQTSRHWALCDLICPLHTGTPDNSQFTVTTGSISIACGVS